MNPSALERMIIQIVEQRLQILTSGSAGANGLTSETIDNLFAGSPSIPDRPIMRPFGFVSRAPKGTISVVGQQGHHPGNRLVLGHRDNPQLSIAEGETALYSIGGYRTIIQNGQLLVGKGDVLEPVVMGTTANDFLIALLNLLIAHTHIGNLGAPTSAPQNAQAFTDLRTQNLDNGKLLAKDGGRF